MAKLTLLLLVVFTGWQWGHASLIQAKAWLAPILIGRAWTESRVHATTVKPWPWADTWPVARLSVPSLNVDQFVLAGANGAALPFGPGHMTGTAPPGSAGTVVIAGHRDTHFRFLPQLKAGARVTLEALDGTRMNYVVAEISLVDSRREQLTLNSETTELILITCAPDAAFSARGPWRLVVRAVPLRNPVGY